MPKQPNSIQPALKEQFADFEAKSREEFDDNGWIAFTDRIKEHINDLYVGTRREYISRVDNKSKLKYSGKDVERASMRLDFQRLWGHKQKRYGQQIGALVGSLLTGFNANWALVNFNGDNPSVWPWVVLTTVLSITVILASLSFIKDMEP